jgi:hypothetical protein
MVGIEQVTLALYCGRGEQALPILAGLDVAGFSQLQPLALAAGCALQAIDQRGPTPELVRVVRRSYRRLPRGEEDATVGLRAHLEAALAAIDGDRERTRALLDRAAEHYARAGMGLHAAATRLRSGQLRGGADGAALIAGAEAFMRAQGLVNLHAWSAFLVPGFAHCMP